MLAFYSLGLLLDSLRAGLRFARSPLVRLSPSAGVVSEEVEHALLLRSSSTQFAKSPEK